MDNLDLSAGEIIYICTDGKIQDYLKSIVKFSFYSLVLKKLINLELKYVKGNEIKTEKVFFLQKTTEKLVDVAISELEKFVFEYLRNSNSEWISLEEFCNKVSALINPRFRAFSRSHRVENYIIKDLINKGLLFKKPIRLFGFILIEKQIPSIEYLRIKKYLQCFKDESWIISACSFFSVNRFFFESNTFKLLDQSIDDYFDQFLLRDGKHIVPAVAIIGKTYPEPL